MNGRVVSLLPVVEAPQIRLLVEEWLCRDDYTPQTVINYRDTFNRFYTWLGGTFGLAVEQQTVDVFTADVLTRFLQEQWGVDTSASPATYTRHRACLQAFGSWLTVTGHVSGVNPASQTPTRKLRRRTEQVRQERPIPLMLLERLFTLKQFPVRDRCLWRMLYETWGRANEILGVNIEMLDVGRRQTVVVGKGGDAEYVFWGTGTARLLSYVVNGRGHGPLFVASRLPSKPVNLLDVDGDGYARLTYRRAEQIFGRAGRLVDPAGEHGRWTLHRLRHSGIAHAAERGVNLAEIRAKSRHASLRSVEPYANPSYAAVARLTAELEKPATGRGR